MNSTSLDFILHQRDFIKSHNDELVIDTDTHITHPKLIGAQVKYKMKTYKGYFQGMPITAEQLINEMDLNGVDMALTWQNPACIDYGKNQKVNYQKLMEANEYIYTSSRKYPTRFIPAGWTDPMALGVDLAKQCVEKLVVEYGFPIVKMNPAQNEFYMDSPMVFEVLETIIGLNAIPAFHVGSDTEYTSVEALEKIAKTFPETPIIAVHMGGGGAGYNEAECNYHAIRNLGLKYANLKFPLSAKRDTHIESDLISYKLAGNKFYKNLFYASDAPYGKIAWNVGGFKSLLKNLRSPEYLADVRLQEHPNLFDQDSERQIMGRNFAAFISEIYSKILNVYGFEKTGQEDRN
ncbi:MAG TPA: amidohydrolase family protein [Anditalea sp.]|nr:amidohydrolase family protein [Anditalea sp.]